MPSHPVIPEPAISAVRLATVHMKDLSDEELMTQVRQGHPDALLILFDRFYRLVLRVALRILRDPGEAEDLMQDVFFEIFNKADQFDAARGSTKTWILQYAYHRSLNRRQYLALRNFYNRHETAELEMSESDSLNASWRGLTFQEWRRILDEGLGTLNERQRKILELSCFQGLLLSEIADRTKESLANVRHHYYRGLEGLRKFMEVTPRSDGEPRNHNKEGKNDE